ncbi:MAG: 2-dehydropantoate 2-reductase [Maricaulaceae bacterium]|jgi:2-dehydropantoate 2-reductase
MSDASAANLAENAKIVIAGAGAVGTYVGVRLAGAEPGSAPHSESAGRRVGFLGRPGLVEAARTKGLVATDCDGGEVKLAPGRAEVSAEPGILAGADLVIVATKSRDTDAMARDIAARAPEGAVVLSLQNGLRNVERLRAALPGRDVRAGMIPFNVLMPEPGVVHRATRGDLRVQDSAGDLAALLTVEGLKTHAHANLDGVMWAKLLINLNSALNALSGQTVLEQMADPAWRELWALCIEEGLAEARAAKVRPARLFGPPPWLMPRILRQPTKMFLFLTSMEKRVSEDARSSMQEDLNRRKPTEIDDLQGEISRRAHARGAAAPVCRAVTTLIRQAEQAGEGPPMLTAARVAEMVRSGRG